MLSRQKRQTDCARVHSLVRTLEQRFQPKHFLSIQVQNAKSLFDGFDQRPPKIVFLSFEYTRHLIISVDYKPDLMKMNPISRSTSLFCFGTMSFRIDLTRGLWGLHCNHLCIAYLISGAGCLALLSIQNQSGYSSFAVGFYEN